MSASDEQICYVQCGFCSTILLVIVPCSRLSVVVAVECGHCNGIIPVNIHLFSSLNHQEIELMEAPPKCALSSDDDEEEDYFGLVNQIIHKPPEKKQRAPSAYNHFIKKEIKRLKIAYPDLTHKQAFSAAAKNWAHYPQNRGGEVNGYAL